MSSVAKLWAGGPGRPRILVLMLDPPSDFLQGSVALTHLRKLFPDSDITAVCRTADVKAAQQLSIANRVRGCDFVPLVDAPPDQSARHSPERFRAPLSGEFDIAIDLGHREDTRPLLQRVNARLRCGFGSQQRFPFLHISLSDTVPCVAAPPIDADEIVLGPPAFRSRMPVQTRFFHETDFSVRGAHLIYGPYCRLPVGTLLVTFNFELNAPRWRHRLDLAIEVVRNEAGNVVAFQRVGMLPTGRTTSIRLEFVNEHDEDRYEFRVFVGGKPRRSRLRFYGVSVERLTAHRPAQTPSRANADANNRALRLLDLVAERTRELTTTLHELSRSDDVAKPNRSWPLSFYPLLRIALDPVVEPAPVTVPPRFTVIVLNVAQAAGNTEATLASVSDQTQPPHEIFLVRPAGHDHSAVAAPIVVHDIAGQSMVSAVNRIGARARGTHLIVLETGSTLHPKALAWFATAVADTSAAVVYSDFEVECRDMSGRMPSLQPAFDYELLLQRNYIGATFCIRREAYLRVGGLTDEPESDPWHDLLLRVTESSGPGACIHLPQILLQVQRRSEAVSNQTRTVLTVQRHLYRTGANAQAVCHYDALGRSVSDAVSVLWPNDPAQRISVIIPTRDSVDLVFALLSSLRRHAFSWNRVDIGVVVNGKASDRTRLGFRELGEMFENVSIIYRPGPFNWCAINNVAVEDARGEILLFLNDDMICLTPSWDARLVGQLSRREVGTVGARLLYPNGSLQHAGLVIGDDGATAHEGSGDPADDGLYRDRTLLVHGAAIVTGAFLACRRRLFDELGGFDAEHYAVTSGDADFCMRVQATGRSVIYDPGLTWIHYESLSRGHDRDDYRKQQRGEAEHQVWRSRLLALDLVDLNVNPQLAGGMRPYGAFRCPDRDRIALWLQAQVARAHRWRNSMPEKVLMRRGPVEEQNTAVVAGESGC